MKISHLKRNLISLLCFVCILFSFPLFSIAVDENAILAGGCFWCLEHDLEEIPGVISVVSGYTGGALHSPTYKNHDGHQEAVIVTFDSNILTYSNLLKKYWKNIDPFDSGGQFCDRGNSYRPVIFVANSSQLEEARLSLKNASKELSIQPNEIKVEIRDATQFWLAEDYHQDFARKNKLKYNFYRYSCGRDKRLEDLWG
ncbi:peptide-methionine (S)-S-oxide reductase MsrA [Prochlorococcus marinus]|uniref:peptide-methionine (S)-S-oxide reductase MsrA n=1 Tax=Prochlorococcus marinus TaxID=1219 RepID=UPI0022B3EB8F|nr:peptide-methionine (S)-S-oxide reductase MsrA [Prochlorococcus marinus]